MQNISLPEELVRTGIERSFTMLPLEKKYTSGRVGATLLIWSLVGSMGIVGTLKASGIVPMPVVIVVLLCYLACFFMAMVKAMGTAEKLQEVYRDYEKAERRAGLFLIFLPKQEQIDVELGHRAEDFNQICERQAKFYAEHHEYLGDVASGKVITIDEDLAREERCYKETVVALKARFWDLHSALAKAEKGYKDNFVLLDSWKDYLPKKK